MSVPPPGAHGGDGRRVALALGLDPAGVTDLSASLNPAAPPVEPLLARIAAGTTRRYPDPADACAALAAALGVDEGRVLLTAGGASAIDLVARERGGHVDEPEFSLHPRGDGGPRWRSDPHSPSGRLAPPDEHADVWDEAYRPLATGRWSAGRPGTVVGSLTKVFACPGLRLGYVVDDDVARYARHQPAWPVGGVELAVLPVLLERADLARWQREVVERRHDLVGLLAEHGLVAEAADAPWVLVDAPGLRDRLAPLGVVVRDCASFGRPGQVRIAVPDDAGRAHLADALGAADAAGAAAPGRWARPVPVVGDTTPDDAGRAHLADALGAAGAAGAAARGRWARPVPVVGDTTSAAQRAARPDAWRLDDAARDGLRRAVAARRDVRRFRPDPVPADVLGRVLDAAHRAPSVGHSQPWRFVVVRASDTRERAALIADRERLAQAAELEPEAGRHLLDLQLEGIREAPLGVVVACDRRVRASGVLGRRTFPDADLWSCACAIQNLWLTARAEGLGVGWVTLFPPRELAGLVGLPDGVETLGWLCVGWPDERPPAPGLERAGWSRRAPLASVVLDERWPGTGVVRPPSHLRGPDQRAVVDARDDADTVLSPPGALGLLDRTVDRVVALGRADTTGGHLVVAGAEHGVAELGVSAYEPAVGREVLDALRAGEALGAAAATAAGLGLRVVDAGRSDGDLRTTDALGAGRAARLVEEGRLLGAGLGPAGLVALGEVGIGNTTVAAALAAALLGLDAGEVVGLGSGADSAIVERKRSVVAAALDRLGPTGDPLRALAALGGPEIAVLTGVALGAAEAGAPVVLDGLATSVAALVAVRLEPGAAAHLVAGHRSRERAHPFVLGALGLEPLLDVRLRAGEGVGACLATGLLLDALAVRRTSARTG